MTLRDLYISVTRDYRQSARTLEAALRGQSARRRRILRMLLAGMSHRQIGARLHISHGSVRSAIVLTLLAIHKELAGLPRYHLVGRARRKPAPAPPPVRKSRRAAA